MDDEAFRKEFQRGLDLWHRGEADAAVATLSRLVASSPDDWRVRLMLGGYLKMSGHRTESEAHLRRATELQPLSELASVSLFHVLWKQGRDDEAFAEMRRFLEIGESKEYRQLLAEWHAEWREKGIIT